MYSLKGLTLLFISVSTLALAKGLVTLLLKGCYSKILAEGSVVVAELYLRWKCFFFLAELFLLGFYEL